MSAGDRPQDEGRRHRKRGEPNAATRSLLERYRQAMRDDLAAVLDELHPVPADPQLGLDGTPLPPKGPSTADRIRLWDLAMKLGRELGEGIDGDADDPSRTTSATEATAPARRRLPRPDFGP